MRSGLVPFEEIIQSIKDGTGYENMRSYYDKIRRLIFRAEREIGYGGTIVLRKAVYTLNQNFDGRFFPYPDDYIEFEGVGHNCCPMANCEYNFGVNGIRFKKQHAKVIFLYWGIACDGYGNPIVTRNHEEAVVAYCIWKMYGVRRFLDKGNANTLKDYKDEWISACRSSRADDAYPTLEQYNEIALTSYADRRGLLQLPTASYSYCDDLIPENCVVAPNETKVYYWQLSSIAEDVDDVENIVDQEYLDSKLFKAVSVFEQGFNVDYNAVGRICFAVQETEAQNWQITDTLNNNVTDAFDSFYLASLKAVVFVSKEYYSHGNIFFKFKKLF